MSEIIGFLVLMLVLLQAVHFFIARCTIQLGGREVNPALVWLREKLAPVTSHRWRWAWLAAPKVVLVAVVLVAHHAQFFMTPGGFVVLLGGVAVYTWAAWYNWRVLVNLRTHIKGGQ